MNVTHRIIAALLLASAGLPAFAGGTATLEASADDRQSRMEVRWSGDNMRMDFPRQQGAYMLVRGDNSYSVVNQGGRIMVMDMSSMGRMAESMGGQARAEISAHQAQSLEGIEATGESETIAGIEGEVYRIQWIDGAGNKHKESAVLSGDPLVVGFTGAFRQFAEAGNGQPDAIGKALAKRELGVLRFGDKLTVVSISDDIPSSGVFELPAEPMDMQEMMKGFGQSAGSE